VFHALTELSEILPPSEAWQALAQPLGPKYRHGFALCFDADGLAVGVRTLEREQVVYSKGRAGTSGYDLTPVSRLAKTLAAGAVPRLARGIRALLEHMDETSERRAWLDLAATGLEVDTAEWVTQANAAIAAAGVSTEERGYLFVARLSDGLTLEPADDWAEVRAALLPQAIASWGKHTLANGTCSLCGAGPQVVYGRYSILKCYNLDKKGTIAGGFDPDRAAARNFPVCAECAPRVAGAVGYALEHLVAGQGGLRYLALPRCSDPEGRDLLRELLAATPERLRLDSGRDLLVAQERDLLTLGAELSAEQGRPLHLATTLVFFQSGKADWRIHGEIATVLPSRVAQVHAAAGALAADPLLAEPEGKGTKPFQITTGLLASLARDETSGRPRRLQAWLTALLSEGRLERGALVHQLVKTTLQGARRRLSGDKRAASGDALARRGWGVYRFFDHLGLLSTPQRSAMPPDVPASPYGDYCRKHAALFDRPELVAAFLTGCYCSVVAYVQYKERKASPFTRRYAGRLLDAPSLRRLYTEGRAKLSQYESLGFVAQGLDPDLAESFVRCGARWTASKDELTFAFTLGLSLQARISQTANAEAKASSADPQEA
jgi:CRISPR-associated protein Csh1